MTAALAVSNALLASVVQPTGCELSVPKQSGRTIVQRGQVSNVAAGGDKPTGPFDTAPLTAVVGSLRQPEKGA